MCLETKRVLKNADLHHPSCTVVIYRRISASPVLSVLILGGMWTCHSMNTCTM